MEPLARTPIFTTLGELLSNLGTLALEVFQLGAHWAFVLLWVAWWIAAVNWKKLWPVLGKGGWAPLLLLGILVALVWSKISPITCGCGLDPFWLQLGYVAMMLGLALICGWLQGLLGWAPADINLNPPVHTDDHGHHGHGGHH